MWFCSRFGLVCSVICLWIHFCGSVLSCDQLWVQVTATMQIRARLCLCDGSSKSVSFWHVHVVHHFFCVVKRSLFWMRPILVDVAWLGSASWVASTSLLYVISCYCRWRLMFGVPSGWQCRLIDMVLTIFVEQSHVRSSCMPWKPVWSPFHGIFSWSDQFLMPWISSISSQNVICCALVTGSTSMWKFSSKQSSTLTM